MKSKYFKHYRSIMNQCTFSRSPATHLHQITIHPPPDHRQHTYPDHHPHTPSRSPDTHTHIQITIHRHPPAHQPHISISPSTHLQIASLTSHPDQNPHTSSRPTEHLFQITIDTPSGYISRGVDPLHRNPTRSKVTTTMTNYNENKSNSTARVVSVEINLLWISAAFAFFYSKCISIKCLTFKMLVKFTDYNIHNGPIRWQISTLIKVVLNIFRKTNTVFEIFTFQNLGP